MIDRATYLKKKAELEAPVQQPAAPTINPDSVRTLLADFPRLLGQTTAAERRAMMQVFFAKVWVQQNTLTAVTPNAIYMELVHALRVEASVSGVADGTSAPYLQSLPIPPVVLAHRHAYRTDG